MENETLLRRLEAFDPDLWKILQTALHRQMSTLSLIPTANAASHFSAYLKGSALGNDFLDHHAAEGQTKLESMASKRACALFKAEHAIVRIGNPIAASRVVLQALAKTGDTILSFNLRKQEHCTGELMQYHFVKFGVEPDTLRIDFGKVRALAKEHKPALIIYSPVNYPYNIDCRELRKIADEVGACFWVDLVQNSGLIAAGEMASPVPHADVATFAANDALHGPQSGIILCRKKYAELLDQTVINTGHVSLKKNVLAALAITFREAACEEYGDYARQALANARALEQGLQESGGKLLCAPTENHLVLLQLPGSADGEQVAEKLARAGLMVKPELLMTADDAISYPILRLSSLDPTTRALQEDDMRKVGRTLGDFLHSPQDEAAIQKVHKVVAKLVENQPLFSEEWLPEVESVQDSDSDLMMKTMVYWNV